MTRFAEEFRVFALRDKYFLRGEIDKDEDEGEDEDDDGRNARNAAAGRLNAF